MGKNLYLIIIILYYSIDIFQKTNNTVYENLKNNNYSGLPNVIFVENIKFSSRYRT